MPRGLHVSEALLLLLLLSKQDYLSELFYFA